VHLAVQIRPTLESKPLAATVAEIAHHLNTMIEHEEGIMFGATDHAIREPESIKPGTGSSQGPTTNI
jgi:hypothetical protein